MTSQPPDPGKPIQPPRGRTGRDITAEREAYATRIAESVAAIRDSARNLRNGLTGFVALVTTGIVVQGHELITGLDSSWRAIISSLVTAGLVTILVGLWIAFRAEVSAYSRNPILADVLDQYSSVQNYEIWLAAQTARKTYQSILVAGLGFILLFAGILLAWWAPR